MAVLTAAVVLALAFGGTAGAKTVSDRKYAKRLCGQMNRILDAVESVEQPDLSDSATAQAEMVALADEVIGAMETAKAKLTKISPEDGGKKVTRIFDRYLADFITVFEDARDGLASADSASPAFAGDVGLFLAAIATSDATVGDPFAELSGNQDLLGAFKDTRSCANIVTIF